MPFVTGVVAGITPSTDDLPSFDKAVDEQASLRMVFMNWGDPNFPTAEIRSNAAAGAQSVLEIMPRNQDLVALGTPGDTQWNAWICSVARNIASLDLPVTISFGSEMNGPWYSWGSGHFKPSLFVRAWRHIHDMLYGTKAGPLITWMWQPSAMHFGTPSPLPWFPGSRYVNIIGLDGYFIGPADTFDVVFAKTISLIRATTDVPIMVGETAIGWCTGHALADMRSLFRGIRFYGLRGVVWFDIAQAKPGTGSCVTSRYHEDFRIQDRPPLAAAFARQVTWTEMLGHVP